jgi:hypothetical protein
VTDVSQPKCRDSIHDVDEILAIWHDTVDVLLATPREQELLRPSR